MLCGTGVLGAERTLELLLAPLQEAGRAGSGGDGSWRTIEAGLYCVRAVHRYWLSLGSLPRVRFSTLGKDLLPLTVPCCRGCVCTAPCIVPYSAIMVGVTHQTVSLRTCLQGICTGDCGR